MNAVASVSPAASRAQDRPWTLRTPQPPAIRGYRSVDALFATAGTERYERLVPPTKGQPAAKAEPRATSPDRRFVIEKQKAIMDAYPAEYVVMVGDRLIAHTPDKKEAFAHWDAAWDEAGEEEEPVVFPPAAARTRFMPVVRGRSVSPKTIGPKR